jgi:hypothetical protein
VYWRVRGDQSVVLEGPHHGLDVYRRKLRQRDPADVGDDVLAHDPAVAGLGAVLHRARQHVIEGSGDQRWLMLAQRQTGLEVVCGYGEHESSDGLAVELAVEVADVAGHLDDADAGGVGDRAVQSVEEGSRRVALVGGELPDRLEVVVHRGDEQDPVVVFDRGSDGKAGGSFGVGAPTSW